MKKITIVGVVILLGILLLVILGPNNSGDNEDVFTITSDDGSASLSIPKDALPEDVSIEDVSIALKNFDDLPIQPLQERDNFISGFELLPDGLELLKPAIFSYSYVDNKADDLPQSLHISETTRKVEPLQNFLAEVDVDTNEILITGEVEHFSWIVNGYSGLSISFIGFSTAYIGDPFTMDGKIEMRHNAAHEIGKSGEDADVVQWIYYDNNFDAEGLMWVDSGGVTPAYIRNVPTTGSFIAGTPVISKGVFVCAEEGDAELSYRVDLTRKHTTKWLANSMSGVLMTIVGLGDKENTFRWVYKIKHDVDCRKNVNLDETVNLIGEDVEVLIEAINYGGSYLPLDQLHITDEEACGARHYHSNNGVVNATDGSIVIEPDLDCGFGHVSEFTVEKVPETANKNE